MTNVAKSLVLGGLFAVAAAVAALGYALPSLHDLHLFFLWVASLASLGFFLGGIYAFDPDSELRIKSSAIGRVSFGIVSALLLSALWRWPAEGVLLAVMVGAILGYLGMLWAKYVDF